MEVRRLSDGSLWTTIRAWQWTSSDVARKPIDVGHWKSDVEWTSQHDNNGGTTVMATLRHYGTTACNPALRCCNYGSAGARNAVALQ